MKQQERQAIERKAQKAAFVFVVGGSYAKQKRFGWFRLQSGDKRTIYGRAYNKAVTEYAQQYESESESAMVKKHNRQRAKNENGQWFCNVLQNALWRDYQQNKGQNTTHVYPDHLRICGRNHWAKTPQDQRVLVAILRARASRSAQQ